jgi:ubiquitin carboxyl-terminal hydrolase 14
VVKWQGKKIDVELDTTEPGSTFKFQLFSLTGVPPERQKVLIKGGQLKDDQDMTSLKLKPGHSFMLLGTAEEGFKAPDKKTVFLEDMTAAQMAKSVRIDSAWLILACATCWFAESRKYMLYERDPASNEEYS